MKKSNYFIKYGTKIAILSAMSAITMIFEFPLLIIAPNFYKLDFSDVFALLGGFAMGPLASVLIELLKNLLKLLINGTSTMFVGELSNFLTGCALVIPASLIYKHKKSFRQALLGLVVGIITFCFIGAIINYFLLIPVYCQVFGINLSVIIDMANKVNSSITNIKQMIVLSVVPFNLIKGILSSIITVLIYKRVSKLLHI